MTRTVQALPALGRCVSGTTRIGGRSAPGMVEGSTFRPMEHPDEFRRRDVSSSFTWPLSRYWTPPV